MIGKLSQGIVHSVIGHQVPAREPFVGWVRILGASKKALMWVALNFNVLHVLCVRNLRFRRRGVGDSDKYIAIRASWWVA
jgi:hypothetical protein